MRRWPVNRFCQTGKRHRGREGGQQRRQAGRQHQQAIDRPAQQANRRQQRQQQEIWRVPFGQPEAEQRDAEHRRRRQGEVDAAGDHVISAHGDNADQAETEDCQRNALDQHQADILPAEKVGRLYAQPYQQRQKQDQGKLFNQRRQARTAATLDSSTHGEGSCPPLIATSRASSVSPRVGRLAASAPRQRTRIRSHSPSSSGASLEETSTARP